MKHDRNKNRKTLEVVVIAMVILIIIVIGIIPSVKERVNDNKVVVQVGNKSITKGELDLFSNLMEIGDKMQLCVISENKCFSLIKNSE